MNTVPAQASVFERVYRNGSTSAWQSGAYWGSDHCIGLIWIMRFAEGLSGSANLNPQARGGLHRSRGTTELGSQAGEF